MSFRTSAVIVLALLLSSCVTHSRSNPFDLGGGEQWDSATRVDLSLRVENKHFDPVVISAVWDRTKYFVGEVSPGGTEVFQIPGHLLDVRGSPRFLAKPKGSAQEQLTAPLECDGVRWVEWRLKRHLMPSQLVVLGL